MTGSTGAGQGPDSTHTHVGKPEGRASAELAREQRAGKDLGGLEGRGLRGPAQPSPALGTEARVP